MTTIKQAMLYHESQGDLRRAVVCDLCWHRCTIPDGKYGICRARYNNAGRLESHVYGWCLHHKATPIEHKPFYHVLPGTRTMSFHTAGCNFTCPWCNNSADSQVLLEHPEAGVPGEWIDPVRIVEKAIDEACPSVTATWTEVTLFFEYALDIAKLARSRGIRTCFVSNGYMTPKAVETMAPYLDAINIDLKSFSSRTYRELCGARLERVLETFTAVYEKGIWIEATTLVIPRLNDSSAELAGIARFISNLSPDIPWHISGFLPRYKMQDTPLTPVETIHEAIRIGRKEGLRYVYGHKRDDPSCCTLCAECNALLIRRKPPPKEAFEECFLEPGGTCPSCGSRCPGIYLPCDDTQERKFPDIARSDSAETHS